MRLPLALVVVVLLAGCIEVRTAPREGAPPIADPALATAKCPAVTARAERLSLAQGDALRVDGELHNCRDVPLTLLDPCAARSPLRAFVRALPAGPEAELPAPLDGPARDCLAYDRFEIVAAGVAINRTWTWDGHLPDGAGGRPVAPPGSYELVVRAAAASGEIFTAAQTVSVFPAGAPPACPRLSLSPNATTITAGQGLLVVARLTNCGTAAVSYADPCGNDAAIYGKIYGAQGHGALLVEDCAERAGNVTLPPGASSERFLNWDGRIYSDGAQTAPPGLYHIDARWRPQPDVVFAVASIRVE